VSSNPYLWPAGAGGDDDDDDPGARGRFVRRLRREFDPDGARAAARAALRPAGGVHARAPVSGNDFLWQPLGPMIVVGGQAIGGPRIAGRVNMLAVHPDGGRLYAASANGGVWFSKTGGASWVSLGGLAATPTAGINRPVQRNACGSIEVAFGASEASDVVYVGTGETTHSVSGEPGDSLGGIGVLIAEHPATSALPDPWVREAKNLVGDGVCRIALQPGGTGVVAATTSGLYERPAGGGADSVWQHVQTPPFKTLGDKCSDVLWTRGDGTRPERLWVWVQDGASAGLWVRDASAPAQFKQIVASPPANAARGVISRVDPNTSPSQFYVLNDAGDNVPPLLFRINCASNAQPTATAVTAGVPQILGKQGFYDIAVATHPTQPDRVVLGGNTFPAVTPDGTTLLTSGGTDDGAVVVGDVALNGAVLTFGQPTPPTMIGVGVHADVHDVVWTNGGNRMWVACDGGVFRSDQPTKQVAFYAVNNGLAVIESNYIACHPTCEGYVVAGLQDNGMISRRSSSLWNHDDDGDGGGVALDPLKPDRYFRQYTSGNWTSSDGTFSLPVGAAENGKAAFYSTPAAIAHRRGVAAGAAPNVQQVIVGTRRVWYTEDFGTTWRTLPSGTVAPVANVGLDAFGGQITVCRWQSPDVAWVLGQQRLTRYARVPGSDAGGPPGSWSAVDARPVDVVPGGKAKKRPPAPPSANDAASWSDVAVNLDPPAAPGQPPAPHGTLGAVYLGTIGTAANVDIDTLWWFDGTDHWYPTGLRKDPNGVPAPVTVIACHPAFPTAVWVGTTVGVWQGQRTQVGNAAPTWTWQGRVNGLPEAAIEDLAVFKDGELTLLRAGIGARGVWELRLDVTLVPELTYVRAHDDDLRHRARAVEKKRDLVTDRSWHGSPDVRPRRAPLSRPAPMTATVPWTQATPNIDAELLRRFQSALRARTGDPRVQPNGRWDGYFNEVLRDLGAPLVPPPGPPAAAATVSISRAFWNLSMVAPHATAEPWGAGVPSEADLADYAAPLAEGDIGRAGTTLARQAHKVDIVIHHRGSASVDGANVRVTLLRWRDPKTKNAARWDDASTWPSGNVSWTAAVNQVLNSADGKTGIALTDGWSFVLGAGNASHRLTLPGQTLDASNPIVATFDLDLAPIKNNALLLLVAVIRTGTSAADDIALVPATLRELTLTSPNVAVRSARVRS